MNLKEVVAPIFWSTFKSKKPRQIDLGGRGSTKTSKNSLKINYHCIKEKKCSEVVLRNYQNTLRNSVYKEIKRAMNRLNLVEGIHYKASLSPLKIELWNGNNIYFAGADVYAVTPKQERGKRMIQEVRKLQKRLHHSCGLPLTLGEIHPDPIDFELVARKAMNDGAILVNPKKAEKKDIIHILEAAYGKEDAQINRIGIISRKILEIADGKKGGRL